MGCELGQGFYFAKPMDAGDIRQTFQSLVRPMSLPGA
jgi:EAL domain-containing protein (putative c-di-GMP-specific phosphodiesterase class I)